MATLLLGEAAAQPPPVDAEEKTVRIQRTVEPPTIDGDLSEELWVRAPPVADFHQVTPVEGDAPSERTEVYVLYDRDALYIGVRLFDAEPDLINARILRQGQSDRRRRPLFRPSSTRSTTVAAVTSSRSTRTACVTTASTNVSQRPSIGTASGGGRASKPKAGLEIASRSRRYRSIPTARAGA